MSTQLDKLKEIEKSVGELLAKAGSQADLDQIRADYLGRKGALSEIMKSVKDLPPEERPAFGQAVNRLKNELDAKFAERAEQIKTSAKPQKRAGSPDHRKLPEDITLPGKHDYLGKRHVLLAMLDEIIEVFHGMGFSVADGPDVDTAFNNFDALNTPQNHPSRDIGDTFYIEGNTPDDDNPLLLRTHTSPVQIRTMLSQDPPLRIIAPGRCYRKDAIDATHYISFWQCEGLYVDKHVTMADLKGVLIAFAREILGPETQIRFRPHFFPFTEPSVEYDFSCICKGAGCRLCKGSGWVEISGAGMVDPEVFSAVGYDPEKWSGYAFGMGVERIALIRHGIDDIRLLYQNDLRFLRQF
ncbi:MAG TPA: phenylalanine--tRNA ligase subunit alpha [candidate division Zixibacteria bacterium]|nr:phenylalanine--tRNA ligase subunit alpha [candidate division Zixibacteria bacterium]